ncbi:hypothetical protein ACFSC6_20050 [Rufibacter sediminis]|uniref:Antitoxin SocA-like Panacea domain-containing protein n=1 Tax=Rufibacter sediminis TaxID=2762756 RepID=A0ABR6VNK0_9BACT|nr:hypothetical protein [Rufibacter sediminis]MBC3538743.1 hypothetical protein [Rufibacter sediminis]
MENIKDKVRGFEYVIHQLKNWHDTVYEHHPVENDLSKLKVIKLHFFISAVCAGSDDDLLNFFDCFYAMPYGHVEGEVYSNLDKMEAFKLTERRLEIRENFNKDEYFKLIDIGIKNKIDNSIAKLKEININLVKYVAMDLVELSHNWYSWRAMYNLARSFNKQSIAIPVEVIRNEPKIYSLATVESLYAVY